MPCDAKQLQGAAICNRRFLACAFASLLAITSDVFAQDAVPSGLRWSIPTGEFEVAVLDKYIYNGYVIQDQGPIVQPYVAIAEEFYNGTGWLKGASARFSFFTSLQSREDGVSHAAAPGRWFYEIQIESGLELKFANEVTLSLAYLRFESPIDAYRPSNVLQIKLARDEEDKAGVLTLHPHVTWLAPIPFRWNPDEGDGNYFEVGIAPTTILANPHYPVTLKLPINAGFGDDTYFPGDHFGYASIGISAAIPLAFLPKDFGKWNFTVAGTYYYLGRAPADLSNDGKRNQSVFTSTLSTEF
jgi:hypothetical protein